LVLPISNEVTGARLLAGPGVHHRASVTRHGAQDLMTPPAPRVTVESVADGKVVHLPNITPDPIATVLVVDIKGPAQVTDAGKTAPKPEADAKAK
jgi:hypothetical protein